MSAFLKRNLLQIVLSAILLSVCSPIHARTYLVSVGIADYSSFPGLASNLNLTVKDARAIVDLYAMNTSLDYAILLDEKATKSRILKAIKQVFCKSSEDDIVVFFFSGHGYTGGFCAYDGYMEYDEIRQAMAQSKCKNKMMFIDACRSGGIRNDENSSPGAITAAKNANVMLFLSSRTDENSLESQSMENGYFTTYLRQGLAGEADADKDQTITAKELFKFVHGGVVEMSYNKQHPVMWGNFADDMPVMNWKKNDFKHE